MRSEAQGSFLSSYLMSAYLRETSFEAQAVETHRSHQDQCVVWEVMRTHSHSIAKVWHLPVSQKPILEHLLEPAHDGQVVTAMHVMNKMSNGLVH